MPFDSLAETPRSRPLPSFSVCLLPFDLVLHMGEEPDLCGGSLCSDQPYSSMLVLVAAVRRRRDTQPVNRHRGGGLRRLFSQIRIPAPCFEHLSRHVPVCHVSVMSISVTAWTEASSSHKDSSLLSLIFFLVSTAQSYPESSQNHRGLHSSV